MLASFVVFLVYKGINASFVSWNGPTTLYGEVLYKKHGSITLVRSRD